MSKNEDFELDKELDKQVFDKLGWKDTHAYWVMDDGQPYLAYGERMNGLWMPHYDTDYLLRKLGDVGFMDGPSVGLHLRYDLIPGKDYQWIAYFPGYGYKYGGVEDIYADTPCKALKKLALALLDKGYVKREGE